MSDYDPMRYDKYGNENRNPLPGDGSGTTSGYVLIALLAAIGVVGGAIYFAGGGGKAPREEQATAPQSTTTLTPTPRQPQPLPGPATAPALPPATTNPAPTNPPKDMER